ncbi:MAG: phosphate acyltransferase PlsX [Alphaproteobacteria bacterium]|nr:phosphate acyltransferase PlsX [Rickettsiales bacterium]
MGNITIAIDVMSGDKDPVASIEAVLCAIKKYHDVNFTIFGNKNKIPKRLLKKITVNSDKIKLNHYESIVKPEDKPSIIVRRAKSTSMGGAIIAVKEGLANAAVSSGNTGALMAIGKIHLGMIKGIERPAICALWPSASKPFVILDMGANVTMTPKQALQFAIMGNAFCSCYCGIKTPIFGLLNVGTETHKGTNAVKEAKEIIENTKNTGGKFIGFVESSRAIQGKCDVLVTDGFSSNIALKMAESSVKLTLERLQNAFKTNIITKIAYLMVKNSIKKNLSIMSPNKNNGAMFVGLNGICVKSHGNANKEAFLSAINTAVLLVKNKINDGIKNKINATADINNGKKQPAKS